MHWRNAIIIFLNTVLYISANCVALCPDSLVNNIKFKIKTDDDEDEMPFSHVDM